MMDKASLVNAFKGVDIVINTANGYGVGKPEVDTEGANNVADAVKSEGVKRYIYCSILTCEKADAVSHFNDKWLHEEYCREIDIPFIALRPGAFIDQANDYLGDGIKAGYSFAVCPWDKTVPIGMIFTPDLAKYFVDAIELPSDANGKGIMVGLTRPINYTELVKIVSDKIGRELSVYSVPRFVRNGFLYTAGHCMKQTGEVIQMCNYFDTGLYVNETDDQKKYFGEPPTPEEAIGRYVETLNLVAPSAETTGEEN
jgi:uncharacterized protein YbjT (DUF2867 family)